MLVTDNRRANVICRSRKGAWIEIPVGTILGYIGEGSLP